MDVARRQLLIEKWMLQAVDCFLQSGNGNPAQKTE